jgi:hypothetical protein
MIKINHKGKMMGGPYALEGEIVIVDDTDVTGGYYIYLWPEGKNKKKKTGAPTVYDFWYENLEQVKHHITSEGWNIKWGSEN